MPSPSCGTCCAIAGSPASSSAGSIPATDTFSISIARKRRLALELDGGQHFDDAVRTYDERRTEQLRLRGIRVLRFSNDLVFRELPAVLDAILLELERDPSP